MSASIPRLTASVRASARGFASTANQLAEGASSAPAPRPRSSSINQSKRPSNSGSRVSERLRAGQWNRSPSQPSGQNTGNRNAGGERRNKRLSSVFDDSSASLQSPFSRGTRVKSFGKGARKVPAPMPSTDWNSPFFSKPGFERLVAQAPRPSSIFAPDLALVAPSTQSSGGKGKGKTAAPTKVAHAKLNLPGIKTAVNALKLHIRAGGRNILGPTNNPTAVAVGHTSQNQVALLRSSELEGSDNKPLAAELKAARITLQNEQIGGSYERFEPESVLKAAGVSPNTKGASTQTKAVQDAAQALAVNPDLAPEGKDFVAKMIAERLGA
ncbi:hypothetical protein NDA11_004615 [Ustilago hordei]|uniref:Uncharacterized protein n=1 Tax=Ustilago hordei TaxID=120017 RepID=I2FQ93_USTHO|nr:uncharacterized protein UHO2_06447 [Ustilago hordei]KAJ1038324.1 hypothetical protein NDA10_001103 [Ustilago hordei]KAJ1570389.1 hypothetical protein NDA15_004159 [Ustilago hordei]KAJ1571736.1 hypothetical protein NDA12_001356 [Ustilago hordei]KAJ1575968.1 hypothetical protein NDA11_004615 [Ustilago hordei]UTT87991.1 hypothetical protein NDA17_000419 [Ustilago hordei]